MACALRCSGTDGWNAGFSSADPERLYSPLISNPVYGYQAINVDSQRALRAFAAFLDEVADSSAEIVPVFSRGSIEFLNPSNHRVLAYVRQFGEETVLVVNNLSSSAQAVELDLQTL